MRNHSVTIVGKAVALGHRIGGRGERMGDNRRCRYSSFLKHGAVGHTGRAARPSIADRSNHHVTLFGHFRGERLLNRIREAVTLGAHHRRFDRVSFFEQVANGGEQRGCVKLGIIQEADRGSVKRAEASCRQLVALIMGSTGGIEDWHFHTSRRVSDSI